MIVNSEQLEFGARELRGRAIDILPLASEPDVTVSAAQLEAAATILKEADPSVCNGVKAERPGFIETGQQEDPEVLVFQMGILPGTLYRIARDGSLL